MKIQHWRHWNIATRLVCITVLPVVLMFVSVVTWSYCSRYVQIRQDLQERGKLVAAALAVSSQYGVISGNLADVERTVHGLLRVDKSIYAIEIFDVRKQPIVTATNEAVRGTKLQVSEAPIRRELVEVNAFGDGDAPHDSAARAQPAHTHNDVVGYVRVVMSPSSMLAGKWKRILIGSAIAGLFLCISAVFGLLLARGLTKPLAATLSMLRRIRSGDYQVVIDARAGGEIGELQGCIADMAQNLWQFKHDMEGKVVARTRDLQVARDEAMKSNAEKRRLIQKVHSVVEEERKNIAVEIHDHLNALLIVVRLESQRILDLAPKCHSSPATGEIKIRAESISKHTSGLYALARDIVKRLRPEVIDTLGLRDAVEEMVRHYDSIHPKCRFEFRAKGNVVGLKSEISMSAYRLIQEALSNVVKHSGATTASVNMHYLARRKILCIIVKDNGRGFDPSTIEPGIGLIGMRERVDGLGGKLKIHTAFGVGTRIAVRLPIRDDAYVERASLDSA